MYPLLRRCLRQVAGRWGATRRDRPQLVTGVAVAAACAFALSVAGCALFVMRARADLPGLDALRRMGDMNQATALFDDRDQLAFTIFREQRIEVPLAEISPNLVRAIVAVEDQRFYEHRGFDGFRIVSAGFANIRHLRAAQGGSTITQQLARQSFLKPEKTIRRKVQELILANRIERLYTKPQILELYLNKVYFGDGLYGAEAASRGYFGKHASELSLPEAALLAGLVKSPSNSAPTVDLGRAVARRNLVLQAMLDTRAIDRATWQAARKSKTLLHDNLRSQEPHGQYFKEQVRRELVDRFGWDRVYAGGLRVFTTVDIPMQVAAEQVVAESLKSIEERRHAIAARSLSGRTKPVETPARPLQAALIALDPATGYVRALIGGRDFNESSFNRAIQARRQPGSAFKPFVYATALEEGYTPATVIDHLDDPIPTLQGAWTPEDEHSSASSMSLRTGLRTSSNRAAVRLLQQVGIPQTVGYAKSMGVGDVPSVPSLALGSGEVTLQSLTAAYAGFANHGLVPRPIVIRRVEDQDRHVLYQAEDASVRAISDTTAFLMTTMLADVVDTGTAAGARRLGFTLPAAGKTGTTNDFNDAWFVGFTPKLAAGVWVGFDQPRTILPNGFAATIAVPVWAEFMKIATRHDAPEWFTRPSGVGTARVCRLSGRLATPACDEVEVIVDGRVEKRSMAYTEYFVRGTEPKAFCDLHPPRTLVGKIAGLFGSNVETIAPPRVEDAGLPAAPAPVALTGKTEIAPLPEPQKKRGFWSRVFGIGRHDGRDRKE